MEQNFEYKLSSAKKCEINEISRLFDNFNVPYKIVKEHYIDITFFSIYYNEFDSQILADILEDLALKYRL